MSSKSRKKIKFYGDNLNEDKLEIYSQQAILDYQYYFLGLEFDDQLDQLVSRCQTLLQIIMPMDQSLVLSIEAKKYFTLDFGRLSSLSPQIAESLIQKPNFWIKLISFSLYNNMKSVKNLNSQISAKRRFIEITNHDNVKPLNKVTISDYEKLVTIKGRVSSLGPINEIWYERVFKCDICHNVQLSHQPLGKFQFPSRCLSTACHSETYGNFTFIRSHPCNVHLASQIITLQDLQRSTSQVTIVKVQLLNHLVDNCLPGDYVMITGILVEQKLDKDVPTTCEFYIEAICLKRSPHVNFDSHILKVIKERAQMGNAFELFAVSLCHSLVIDKIVKAGIILSLFGAPEFSIDNLTTLRGSIHILLIGAQGLGKSALINDAATIVSQPCIHEIPSPNNIFGTNKDGKNYCFNVGPILQCNDGLCCIHDIERMKGEYEILKEIMQYQEVPLSRHIFNHSLPLEVSILASSTPCGGRFSMLDKNSLNDIKLSKELIDNFDLIFLVKDIFRETNDLHHINCRDSSDSSNFSSKLSFQPEIPLQKRLADLDSKNIEKVPYNFLSAYVSYAKAYIKPKFSKEAEISLINYHKELLSNKFLFKSWDTLFKFESLMRLCLARARVDLSEEVTEYHVKDVIELVKASVSEYKINSRRKSSQSLNKKNFIKIMINYAKMKNISLFTLEDMIEIKAKHGINIENFNQFIDQLNESGYLIKKSANKFQLIVSC